jgi:DNA polymerase-3 subunit epsilon
LDALCKRYGIDASHREQHGALLDAKLLAQVYLELIGGRQAGFDLASGRTTMSAKIIVEALPARTRSRPLSPRLNGAELERHHALVAEMGSHALWLKAGKS